MIEVLLGLSLIFNVVLLVLNHKSMKGWEECIKLLNRSHEREVALEKRLEPFKAYEDQVSR